MGIKIRTVSLVIGAALATSAAVAAPVGAVTPINGVGTVSCLVKGSVTYVPPLIAGGTVSTTITLSTTEFSCTGTGNGANVTGGSSKTSHVSSTNDCATVLTAPFQTSQGALKWKVLAHTTPLNASTIQFTSGSSSLGPPITTDSSGSSTAGSFNGDTATAHAQIKQTLAQITAACTPPKGKGLKSLTIVSPQSTFVLS